MIKLVASDVDGTLLQSKVGKISPEMFAVISRLSEMGILFVAASGRQYGNLRNLFLPVQDKIAYICENGALVAYQEELLFRYEMPRDLGNEILNTILKEKNCEIMVSGVHTCYINSNNKEFTHYLREELKNHVTDVEDLTKIEESYLKISIFAGEDAEKRLDFWNQQFDERVKVVTSGNGWLDIIPSGVDKGTALKVLQKKLHVSRDEIIAFGDNYNDIEMLTAAGVSVAVENAKEGVKAVCEFETDTVEQMIESFLEGKRILT